MQKFRSSILIISLVVIGIAASLLTVLGLYFSGVLKTELVELVYSVQSMTKAYDGTPLTSDVYELVSGNLLKGHVASVTPVGEQTDVGTGECSLEVKIRDEKGFDVPDEYAVKVESGALIVSPAEIFVSLMDEEVVYNGKKVIFENYTVDHGRLVDGHKIAGSLPGIGLLNVDEYLPEDLVPVVYDAAGKNVSSNYTVAFDFDSAGRIRIVPRPITVAPVDVRKTYDGAELVADEYKIISGSLAEDQWAEVVINGGDNKMTNAGVVDTQITSITIYAIGGGYPVDVTSNYSIDVSETGTMQIDRRSLVLTAKSASWTYDGVEHSLMEDTLPETVSGLAPSDSLVSVRYGGTIREVGEEQNDIEDVTLSSPIENYNVQILPGRLTVTPFRATVALKNFTKEYDGETATDTFGGETIYNVSPALPDGFSLAYTNGGLPNVSNAGSYPYTFEGVEVQGDGGDCTKNFDLTLLGGTVTINRRAVTVTTKSESKEYDGTELKNDIPTLVDGVSGHTVSMKNGETAPSLVDAGTLLNSFECVVYDGGRTDVTQNYRITYSYGTLNVTKKAVSFNLNTQIKKAYTGEEQAITLDDAFAGVNLSEMKQEDFELTFYSALKNVGKYAYSAILKDATSARNYDLTIGSGLVEITKKAVTVRYGLTGTGSVTKVYDGKPVELNLTEFQLLNGDGLELVSIDYDKRSSYGTHTLGNFRNAVIRNGRGEEITANLDIAYEASVSATVESRTVTFSLRDYWYEGSDYPETISSAELKACASVGQLAEGDWAEFSVRYDAATHTIRITGVIFYNANNEELNYEYDYGTLPTAKVILVN